MLGAREIRGGADERSSEGAGMLCELREVCARRGAAQCGELGDGLARGYDVDRGEHGRVPRGSSTPAGGGMGAAWYEWNERRESAGGECQCVGPAAWGVGCVRLEHAGAAHMDRVRSDGFTSARVRASARDAKRRTAEEGAATMAARLRLGCEIEE